MYSSCDMSLESELSTIYICTVLQRDNKIENKKIWLPKGSIKWDIYAATRNDSRNVKISQLRSTVFFLSNPIEREVHISRFTTFPRERDFPRLESTLSIILSRIGWSA